MPFTHLPIHALDTPTVQKRMDRSSRANKGGHLTLALDCRRSCSSLAAAAGSLGLRFKRRRPAAGWGSGSDGSWVEDMWREGQLHCRLLQKCHTAADPTVPSHEQSPAPVSREPVLYRPQLRQVAEFIRRARRICFRWGVNSWALCMLLPGPGRYLRCSPGISPGRFVALRIWLLRPCW